MLMQPRFRLIYIQALSYRFLRMLDFDQVGSSTESFGAFAGDYGAA